MKFFRDVHPLGRLVHMESGGSVGAMVTNDPMVVARLLERLFDNRMEYDLDHRGDGYFRLKERLTESVVRFQTNDRLLEGMFSNYYKGVEWGFRVGLRFLFGVSLGWFPVAGWR